MTNFFGVHFFIGIICLTSCFQALGEDAGSVVTTSLDTASQSNESIKQLVAASNSIILARVLPKTADRTPDKLKKEAKDLKKIRELDEKKAREGRAKPLADFFAGAMLRVETVEVLKGPKTKFVMVPAKLDNEAEALVENALYLIFLGSTHERARVLVVSEYDSWVEQVKALIDA